MNKKYAAIILIAVFLTGVSSPALCLTDRHENKSSCCSGKSAPVSSSDEDCLWHCAVQKIVAGKIEYFSIERSKTDIPLFLQHMAADISPDLPRYSNYPARFYLGQDSAHLNIHQIYFENISSRAPPSLVS